MTKKEVRKLIKKSRKLFYTYGLLRPDESPFYIGKGKNLRLFDHEKEIDKDYCNPIKADIIKEIYNINEKVKYKIYKFFDDENKSLKLEISLIEKFGRIDLGTGILTNLTNGGDSGVLSEYSIEKIRESSKNMWKNENFRIKQIERMTSTEGREKASKVMKKCHEEDPDLRIKQAKSREKYFKDSEFRERIGNSRKQFNINNPEKYEINQQKEIESSRTPEARKKNSIAKTQWFIDTPEKSIKRSEKIRISCNTEEYKEKQRVVQKKRFENPKQIEKCSKAQKKRFSDPSQREHQRQKSLEIAKEKKLLIDECLTLIKTHQIPIKNFPSKKSSIKTFQKVKNILLNYINKNGLISNI